MGEPAAAVGRLSVAVAPDREVSGGVVAGLAVAAVLRVRAGRAGFFGIGTGGGSSADSGGVSVVNSSGLTDFLTGDLARRIGVSAQELAARERYKRLGTPPSAQPPSAQPPPAQPRT